MRAVSQKRQTVRRPPGLPHDTFESVTAGQDVQPVGMPNYVCGDVNGPQTV